MQGRAGVAVRLAVHLVVRAAPSSSAPRHGVRDAERGPAAPTPAKDPAADVGDACAYDPVAAQEALAAGQPPTKNG